jgi:hypothetical protein
VSTIVSNFNGTAVNPGSTLWFNSVMKVSGLGANPVTLHVTEASVTFTPKGAAPQTVSVPDADVTFDPLATSAATAFDPTSNTWMTTAPSNLSGNVFLAGAALPVPGGLSGGLNPVTWQANFSTNTPGVTVTVNWQWAAAVYTSFSTDYTTVGVKPVDSNQLSVYQNSDHAGTPEAFRSFVVGGARGGGGSNFTGSYSATGHVTPDTATATLTATVVDSSNNPVAGVTVTLTWTDSLGTHSQTATTDSTGAYAFDDLSAGSYTVSYTDQVSGNTGSSGAIILGMGGDAVVNFVEPTSSYSGSIL